MGTRPAEARIMTFLRGHRGRYVHTAAIAAGADCSRETVRRVLRDLDAAGQLQSGPAWFDPAGNRRTGTLGWRLLPGTEA